MTQADLFIKYDIQHKAQLGLGKPSDVTFRAWISGFEKQARNKIPSLAKNKTASIPKTKINTEGTTTQAPKIVFPDVKTEAPQAATATEIEQKTSETVEPPTVTPPADQASGFEYKELRFLKVLMEIPSKGAAETYEKSFLKRGVDLNAVPLLNYPAWKELQQSSVEAAIRKYGIGWILPEWLQKLDTYFPLIDLAAAYTIPAIGAGLWVRMTKGDKKKEEAQKGAGDPQPDKPTVKESFPNADGTITILMSDGTRMKMSREAAIP